MQKENAGISQPHSERPSVAQDPSHLSNDPREAEGTQFRPASPPGPPPGLLTFRVIAGLKDVQLMGVVCERKHLNHGVQNHHNPGKRKTIRVPLPKSETRVFCDLRSDHFGPQKHSKRPIQRTVPRSGPLQDRNGSRVSHPGVRSAQMSRHLAPGQRLANRRFRG